MQINSKTFSILTVLLPVLIPEEMVSLSTEEDEAVWDRILAESVHTYYPIFAGRSEDVVGILDGKAYFRMKDHTRDKVMQCYFSAEAGTKDRCCHRAWR